MWSVVLLSVALGGPPECRELDAPASAGAPTERVGTIRNAAWLALRAYQVVVSPGDGARCSMYPSCSAYAVRAVRRRGPLLGAFMATSRILSDHGDRRLPVCASGDRVFLYDPPEPR